MRLRNIETGIQLGNNGKTLWTWFERQDCPGGCIILSFGPFYLTVLRGECNIYEE